MTPLETEIKTIADWLAGWAENIGVRQLSEELDMPQSTIRYLIATDLRGATYRTLVRLAREMEGV